MSKAKGGIRQFVTTAPTFHNGVTYPAGALIEIDTDVIELRPAKGNPTEEGYDPGNMSNLADPRDVVPTAPGPMSTVSGETITPDEAAAMRDRMADLEARIALLTAGSPAADQSDGAVVEEEAASALAAKDDGKDEGKAEKATK